MNLTEFLLARIAEDEAVARRTAERMEHVPPSGIGGVGNLGIVGYPLARVLAECKAKRRVVEDYRDACEANRSVAITDWPQGFGGRAVIEKASYSGLEHGAMLALRRVGAVYADHPDYDEAWRA